MEKLKGGQVGESPKKLFVCYHGFAGEGKTTQLLTFPPPLYILNCGDRDIKYLLNRLPENYDIYYEWLIQNPDAPQLATSYIQRADAMLAVALKSGQGSFLIDAVDIFWDYIQAAKITKPEGTALRFKPANEYAFDFLQRLTVSPLQVGVTALASEVWEGPSATGRFTHGGWKHIDRYLTTDIRVFHKEQMVAGAKPVTTADPTVTHAAYFAASKLAEHLLRRIVDNISFSFLYKMTFGVAHPDAESLWKPS